MRAHTHASSQKECNGERERGGAADFEIIVVVLCVEAILLKGMGELNVMNVRNDRIPLLWGTVRERTLARCFCCSMWDTKYPCICKGRRLLGMGVHRGQVREIGRGVHRGQVREISRGVHVAR